MTVCTRYCLPFHTCQYSDKERKRRRVVFQYPERLKPSRWLKRTVKQTDMEMEKYKSEIPANPS